MRAPHDRSARRPAVHAHRRRSSTCHGRNQHARARRSRGTAKSVSQDVDAHRRHDRLRDVAADGSQRVHRVGQEPRPRDLNPTYDIIADSLDVRMPDQRMREIRALRDALRRRASPTPRRSTRRSATGCAATPSSRTSTARRRRSTTRRRSRRIDARSSSLGHARSFYQIARQGHDGDRDRRSTTCAASASTVAFAESRRSDGDGHRQAAGVYLEPAKPPADEHQDSGKPTPPPSRRRTAPARAKRAPGVTPR